MSEAADVFRASAKGAKKQAPSMSASELLRASAQGAPIEDLVPESKPDGDVEAWNKLPWYARATIAPDEMTVGGMEARNAANADSGAVLANVVANSTVNIPGQLAGFGAKVVGQVGRNFNSDIDPAKWRENVERFTTIPAIQRGEQVVGEMAAPVVEGWNRKIQPILDRNPVLGAAAETAGTALEGAGWAAGLRQALKPKTVERVIPPSPAPEPPPLTASGHPRELPKEIGKTESGTPIPAEPSNLTASGNPRAAFWEPPSEKVKVVDSEPVTGGLPPAYSKDRAQILDRIGLETARESALTGDAQKAATDWQLKKFDEPAGKAAYDQFESEKRALNDFSGRIIDKTRGTRGLDEDTLNNRGQSIAAPFDELREWFKDQRGQLYQKADERSGGHAVVEPLSLEEVLNDRSFNNQMTARGQTHMVSGIKSELERFKEANGGALTVKEAEQFRQFLNTVWTPENSAIVGRLKGALDDDVLKGAGEDLYGPARAMAQMEKQTLDNPNGIAKLFDVDPRNPINRATALDKIPDTLNRLSPDQFSNVIKTLQSMPEALQPQAQAAISEIKAHLANKVMEAGSKTQGQWNAPGVSEYLRKNSAKLKTAFEDQPELLAELQDLDSAGRILKVDQSYPGAAAQAANALKRGFMSQAVSRAASGTGALAGSVLGPLGSMGGAVVGEHFGQKMGSAMGEKKALGDWQATAVNLKELLQRPTPLGKGKGK